MKYESMKKTELIAMIRQIENEKMNSPGSICELLHKMKIDHSRENFILIVLDNRLRILLNKVLFTGGAESSMVDLKILFRVALTIKKCSSIIIAHNHPSNDCTPSKEDISLMKGVQEACKIVGIKFLDSIIFSELFHHSMQESGDLT